MTDTPTWLKRLQTSNMHATIKYFNWDYGVEKLWLGETFSRSWSAKIKRHGTPLVGRLFKPHFTLGIFTSDNAMRRGMRIVKPKKISFAVKQLHVCQLGSDFTCQKIIKKISL